MNMICLLLPDDVIANEIFGYVGKGHFYFVALVNKNFYVLYKRFLLNDDMGNSSSSSSRRHGTTSYNITTFRSCSESTLKCQLFLKESYNHVRKQRRLTNNNSLKIFKGCSMMWNYDKCCYELLKITAVSGNVRVFYYLLRKIIGRSKIQKLLKNLRWHSSNNNRKVMMIKSYYQYYHHIIDKCVFESAVKNGNLDILKIARHVTKIPFNSMYTKQMMAPLSYQPCYPCNIAVTHQQLTILKWLHGPENECNVDEWTFQLASKTGNIEILEYLFSSINDNDTTDTTSNCNCNCWSKVKWNEIYDKVLECSAYYGHIDVMEFLRDKQPKYQWNDNAIQIAINVAQQQNQFDSLNWLEMQR